MRQDGQGFALAVFVLVADQILLARRIVAEDQDRRFREGPREGRIAELRAGGTIPLARGCLGACDPAAIGTKSCTRGKRALSCISYKSTRLRIFPMPGTVWSQYRVLAACGLAVVTMATSRSRGRAS